MLKHCSDVVTRMAHKPYSAVFVSIFSAVSPLRTATTPESDE